MIRLVIEVAGILSLYAVLWFGVSVVARRNDLADVAWGMGYALICLYCYLAYPSHPVAILCYTLILIWAVRLSAYIYIRNRKKAEDFRYQKWRQEWGKYFYIRSFFQVYLLQAFFVLIIISPVMLASSESSSSLTGWTLLGCAFWITGFIWQAVGDYQLAMFKRRKRNPDEILNTGLWNYSRHPNYFGELLMWWAIYLIILPLPNSYYFVIGPITITLLIRYVSGVPMLEERFQHNAQYQLYKKKVPPLFPKFW
ncbi:MAG: DUF1295 domain-containing protein [Cyclobacteriaceae bacterium]|nr:DUF1295 domain-containing protein [Cyclobacteriaceae bacterium]